MRSRADSFVIEAEKIVFQSVHYKLVPLGATCSCSSLELQLSYKLQSGDETRRGSSGCPIWTAQGAAGAATRATVTMRLHTGGH